ncbi:MAG: hypothetical protein ACKO96_05095 [Flammeovirgaceae bacterium]
MTNLATARAIIKDNLEYAPSDTSVDQSINRAVREAIQLSESKRYWFLRKTTDVALSAGSLSLTLPADLAMPESFSIVDTDARYPLRLIDYQTLQLRFLNTTPTPIAQATHCAIVGRTLYLSHANANNTSIGMIYYARDAVLPINDTDTSVWFGREVFDITVALAEYIFQRRTQQKQLEPDILLSYQRRLDRQHEIWTIDTTWG